LAQRKQREYAVFRLTQPFFALLLALALLALRRGSLDGAWTDAEAILFGSFVWAIPLALFLVFGPPLWMRLFPPKAKAAQRSQK
jgi:hypothetical protein